MKKSTAVALAAALAMAGMPAGQVSPVTVSPAPHQQPALPPSRISRQMNRRERREKERRERKRWQASRGWRPRCKGFPRFLNPVPVPEQLRLKRLGIYPPYDRA